MWSHATDDLPTFGRRSVRGWMRNEKELHRFASSGPQLPPVSQIPLVGAFLYGGQELSHGSSITLGSQLV